EESFTLRRTGFQPVVMYSRRRQSRSPIPGAPGCRWSTAVMGRMPIPKRRRRGRRGYTEATMRLLVLLGLLMSGSTVASAAINVVPKPARVEESPGEFALTASTRIIASGNRGDVFAVGVDLADHLSGAL